MKKMIDWFMLKTTFYVLVSVMEDIAKQWKKSLDFQRKID